MASFLQILNSNPNIATAAAAAACTVSSARKHELSEKMSKEVLRAFYLIIDSGSKRITMGMEPDLDFAPILHVQKPGFDSVGFSMQTWQELLSGSGYIDNFFKGELTAEQAREEFTLHDSVRICFRRQYGRQLLSFKSVADEKKEVILAEGSWKRLYELSPLINRKFEMMTAWQPEVLTLFVDTARMLKKKLPAHLLPPAGPAMDVVGPTHSIMRNLTGRGEEKPIVPDPVREILFSMDFAEMETNLAVSRNFLLLDCMQVFLELKFICAHDLLYHLQFV